MTEYILKVQKTMMPAPLKACTPKTTPPVGKAVNYDTFTLYSSLLCQQMESFSGLVPQKASSGASIMVFCTFSMYSVIQHNHTSLVIDQENEIIVYMNNPNKSTNSLKEFNMSTFSLKFMCNFIKQ